MICKTYSKLNSYMKKFQRDFLELKSVSNTDKLRHHGYHRFYSWFLAHFREEDISLLEIGIQKTESLKFWKAYFKNLNLYGIDINETEFNDPDVKIFKVDQSKAFELEGFVKEVETKFDIILDDGSHVPDHQLLTLNKLWELLKPGGVYIVEDIETSYWGRSSIYGYKFNAKRTSAVKKITNAVDILNTEINNKKSSDKYLKNIASEIEMITFAYNCVVLVKKDPENFSEFYNRDYRFASKIDYRNYLNYPKRIFNFLIKKILNKS